MNNSIDKTTAPHYTWGNNCDSYVLCDTEGLSVKQETMPAGTREQLHLHHQSQQFFFILSGTATFYLNGKKQLVNAQTGLHIQPQTQHYIANETAEVLEFLVISQPTTNNDRTEL